MDDRRLAEIYAEHGPVLRRFLLGLTNGEWHSAEDLLQETMVRAWRSGDRLPTDEKGLRTWLFTVGRRTAIDAARRRKARPTEVSLTAAANMARPDDTAGTVLAGQSLRRALRDLRPAQRLLLTQLYAQGMTVEQAAERLDIPAGTVRSRVHYALRAVRAALADLN
ncbi:sigma-70 family RNA polymerase sigma factor [Micromonospora sp. NPDC049230]|uniref:sigma-70 family RNA polymerase sigma factor n=1 Tax=Micromonospora sp. NPDC049230 TaxID=3155502 RepID=UPI0033D7E329